MKKISNLLMMALLTVGMGLTSCDEQLDNAVTPYTPGVTPETDEQGEVAASSIALDQTMKVIKLGGDALTITATATPTDATLTWESSDEAVATVTNGVVTPVGNGIATITAKSGDVKATCEVFVGNEVDLGTKTDDYPVQNYDILKGNMGANQLTIPAGYYVAFDGLAVNGNNIKCDGTATIILADGSENTVTAPNGKAGIQIGGTGTLTINAETAGTGTLTAKGGAPSAGIGTSVNGTGGNIVINGGTVTATSDASGAGIGTGFANGPTSTNECGAITINGGTVTATGGDSAAGIGTGPAQGNSTNKCGDITINGGTVIATGGNVAAGIGTGFANGSTTTNECGAITIGTGVTSVTATKGTYSTNNSIGKGSGAEQKCGTITFGTKAVFNGSAWSPSPANMVSGSFYGGLKLVISKKYVDDDTWTLTPPAE